MHRCICISLQEKCSDHGNVSQAMKRYFGDISNVSVKLSVLKNGIGMGSSEQVEVFKSKTILLICTLSTLSLPYCIVRVGHADDHSVSGLCVSSILCSAFGSSF